MSVGLEDLRETLQLSTGATTLTPIIIDRLLNELQRKYGPLHRAFPRKTWMTNKFLFNQRTALPKAQFTTEAPATSGTGSVAASQSTYVQKSFDIKHTQSQIDVSTFSAKVAIVNGPLVDLELSGAAKSMEWLEETTHMWGAAGATQNTYRPQWDGVDQLIASTNKVDAASQLLAISHLDNLIDTVKGVYAGQMGTDWFFTMSPRMQSRLNGLFVKQQRFNQSMTKIFTRDDYGDPNAPVADSAIDAGIEVQTYRSIPIVLSTFMSNVGSMGSLTSVSNNTGSGGGLLAANTYYYMVEAVSRYGLTSASAEYSASPSADGKTIIFSWTTPTPTDAFGNTIDIIGYRIYRGTSSGSESLYATVSAYDLSDAAVTQFSDTGLAQNPAVTNTLYWSTVTASGTAASDGVTFPRVQTGSQITEDIWLLPRDPEILVVPEVNPLQTMMLAPVNARTRQFALTSDKTLAVRAGAFMAKLSRVRAA
jgi:hypothetical protein